MCELKKIDMKRFTQMKHNAKWMSNFLTSWLRVIIQMVCSLRIHNLEEGKPKHPCLWSRTHLSQCRQSFWSKRGLFCFKVRESARRVLWLRTLISSDNCLCDVCMWLLQNYPWNDSTAGHRFSLHSVAISTITYFLIFESSTKSNIITCIQYWLSCMRVCVSVCVCVT